MWVDDKVVCKNEKFSVDSTHWNFFRQINCLQMNFILNWFDEKNLRGSKFLFFPHRVTKNLTLILQLSLLFDFQRLEERMSKRSEKLDRDAEYIKTLKVSRLPGYLTVQMVRFQFKQKDAINAKILKDIKFPMMLDTFDLCSQDLQNKLVPMRAQFKAYEDSIVETVLKFDDFIFQ